MTLRAQDNRNNLLLLVRLIFNSTVLIWLSFYEIEKRKKKKQPELLWHKTHFLFPQFQLMISELLKNWRKTILFLNGMFRFFFCFFFPRNNQTQEILYSIFFSKSWWPTCCFCVSDSFDEWEKRLGYSSFQKSSDGHSCSGLGFPLWSYNKSQNNTCTIQLLKQRLKDRKWSLDLKTFL